MGLREDLINIAIKHPETAKHILPMLSGYSGIPQLQKAVIDTAAKNPKIQKYLLPLLRKGSVMKNSFRERILKTAAEHPETRSILIPAPVFTKKGGEDWMVTPKAQALAKGIASEIKKRGGRARANDFLVKVQSLPVGDQTMSNVVIKVYEGEYSNAPVLDATLSGGMPLPIGNQSTSMKPLPWKAGVVVDRLIEGVVWIQGARRAAAENPSLRKHLVPLFRKQSALPRLKIQDPLVKRWALGHDADFAWYPEMMVRFAYGKPLTGRDFIRWADSAKVNDDFYDAFHDVVLALGEQVENAEWDDFEPTGDIDAVLYEGEMDCDDGYDDVELEGPDEVTAYFTAEVDWSTAYKAILMAARKHKVNVTRKDLENLHASIADAMLAAAEEYRSDYEYFAEEKTTEKAKEEAGVAVLEYASVRGTDCDTARYVEVEDFSVKITISNDFGSTVVEGEVLFKMKGEVN